MMEDDLQFVHVNEGCSPGGMSHGVGAVIARVPGSVDEGVAGRGTKGGRQGRARRPGIGTAAHNTAPVGAEGGGLVGDGRMCCGGCAQWTGPLLSQYELWRQRRPKHF